MAFVEEDDFGAEQEGFVDVVGDGEDGEAALGEPGSKAGEEVVAEGAVGAGEGLVEQEQVGVGDGAGAGEVDALLLAAGELVRAAAGEGDGGRRGSWPVGEGEIGFAAGKLWGRLAAAKKTLSRTVR